MNDNLSADSVSNQSQSLEAAQSTPLSDSAASAAWFADALFERREYDSPWLGDRSEDRLRRERNFVAAVLDAVGVLIVILDREGRIVRFNWTCEQVTGYRADEVLEHHVWDRLLLPEEIEPVKAIFSGLRAGDFPVKFENHWVSKDGRRRLITWANSALTTDDGVVEYVIGTGVDITEQRAAEQEIKHMSSFPQLNPNPVLEVDSAGNIVFCNAGALRTLEQIGCELAPSLFLPPDLPAIRCALQQSPTSALQREVKIADAYFAESLHHAPGFETIRIYATDITKRKQVEEQLRYQAFLLENISDAIIATDLDFRILNWNKAAEEIYGWSAAEVNGKPVNEVLRGEFTAPVTEITQQLLTEGWWKGEVIHHCKDGHKVHILASTRLLRAADGTPVGIVSANRDITERKRTEEALRDSEARLANVVTSAMDAIIIVDDDQRIVMFNAAAEQMFRCTAQEVTGQPLERFIPERFRTIHRQHIRNFGQTGDTARAMGKQLSLLAARADGEEFPIEASISQASVAGQKLYTVILRDITHRKRAESQKEAALEALRRSEERYALAQRAANIGSWDWDISSGQLHWSDRLEPLFGFQPGTFGGTYEDFLNCVYREDREQMIEAMASAIETGKGYAIEHRIIWPDGSVRWMAETGDVMRDDQGQVQRLLGVAQDVTERRRFLTTLEESNAELRVRNEELNAFAHSVAHDIKNPLQLIIAASELLNDQFRAALPEDARLPLELIVKGGHKLNAITDSLLLLSEVRRSEIQLEPLSMGAIVAETRRRLGDQLDAGVELCLPDIWPPALGYAPWIEEVWSNFLINALKYAGRPLRIELGGERLATGLIRFWVRDNGVGISPKVHANLFTTSNLVAGPRRRGHGLGLSIVKRIVEKMGGEVGAHSSGVPGEGSVFYFTLPAAHCEER